MIRVDAMSSSTPADGDAPKAPSPGFEQLAKERAQDADDLLDIQWWRAWSWSRRPWDSEARKSLARIKTSLETARVWHDQDRLGDHEQQFERVLARPLTNRSLDTLIELVYALDELLVTAGDAEFVRRRLCAERLPDGDETQLKAVQDELTSNPAPSGEPELAAARQQLRMLYEMRRFRYRRLRARRRMKTAVLLLAGMLLLGLVVVLSIGIDDAVDGHPSLVLLAGAAGALGGTLANLFRLRDDLNRGTELRAFKPSLLAQPAVGAASGLVVLLAVEGGFLGIADQDDEVRWATTTMLAFAAGFSEALFVGIVRRAADAFSDDASSTASKDRPGPGADGKRKGA
jgi:hypothetical protein